MLRLVKDFIIERGCIEEIKVTHELLRMCERASKRYGAFLEQQKKVEEQMKLARVKKELAKQTKEAVFIYLRFELHAAYYELNFVTFVIEENKWSKKLSPVKMYQTTRNQIITAKIFCGWKNSLY